MTGISLRRAAFVATFAFTSPALAASAEETTVRDGTISLIVDAGRGAPPIRLHS